MIRFLLPVALLLSFGATENNANKFNQEKIEAYLDSTLQTGWYYIIDKGNGIRRKLDRDSSFYFINPTPIVTVKNIKTLEIYESKYGDTGLSMKFDDNGTIAWAKATQKTIGRQLAFVFGNKLLYTPKIKSQITDGTTALNRGIYTKQELENIRKILERERHN